MINLRSDLLVLCASGIHAVDLAVNDPERPLLTLCRREGSIGSPALVTCPECRWLLDPVHNPVHNPMRATE